MAVIGAPELSNQGLGGGGQDVVQPDRLRLLATAIGGRVGRCDHFNPNQGQVECREAKGKLKCYRVRVGESRSRFSLNLRGFETSIAFAVGEPDRICVMDRQLRLAALGSLQVYVSEDLAPDKIRRWLKNARNLSVLQAVGCTRLEPLQVYRNGLSFLANPRRATPDLLALLVKLADALPRPRYKLRPGQLMIDGLALDTKALPKDLRGLVPHIVNWAVGDDVERQERIDNAMQAELTRLLKEVGPSLGRINEFLDSFGSRTFPNEAILLGRLAEAVVEVSLARA
jgi:hypothetical protein